MKEYRYLSAIEVVIAAACGAIGVIAIEIIIAVVIAWTRGNQ